MEPILSAEPQFKILDSRTKQFLIFGSLAPLAPIQRAAYNDTTRRAIHMANAEMYPAMFLIEHHVISAVYYIII
jgi:hypothetical protein